MVGSKNRLHTRDSTLVTGAIPYWQWVRVSAGGHDVTNTGVICMFQPNVSEAGGVLNLLVNLLVSVSSDRA